MTRPTDPVQYAKYLRTGNVIEIAENRYEVKGGDYVDSDNPLHPNFRIHLEMISTIHVEGAQRPKLLMATLTVDPHTIIPVLE